MDIFRGLKHLIGLIEQFYYYNSPEDKYMQKKKILTEITKLRTMTENKLINPESYLLADEVLVKWEHLVESEFKQFVGTPTLNIELKTKKLLASERINLIFDIANNGDIPMMNLVAKLLPSEHYSILGQEKKETHRRPRLTKSNDQNKRKFSPEFVIIPELFPYVQVRLEVEFFTEEGKRFVEDFEEEIELFHGSIDFKEIDPNPYVIGGPLRTQKMFYGRENVFREIQSTIVGDELINQTIIYGQNGVGKTSVLYQLMNVLTDNYVPVLVVMHKSESGSHELLCSWSTQISSAIRNHAKELPIAPVYDELSYPYKGFREFVEKAVKELGGAKLVFMVDEYDLIDELVQSGRIDVEVVDLLDWMVKHDRIEIVMVGRLPIVSLETKELIKIARPFVQIKLGPLDEKNARKLIEEPVEGYLNYDDSAVECILRLTNGHPYLVQLCCHSLISFHNRERKPILTYADVEEKIPDIIELGSPGLEAMILTDTTDEEKIVLRVMAAFLREQTSISEEELVIKIAKYNPQIKDNNIRQALSNLEKREVIRSVTEEMRRFKFVYNLFRYWIYTKMEPLRFSSQGFLIIPLSVIMLSIFP